MPNTVSISTQLAQETITWKSRVLSAGGDFEWNSVAVANNLIKLLKTKSYYGKIKYLLPLLGKGIDAAKIPLIDSLNAGPASNVNFANSDFNQSVGLNANGTSQYLNVGFTPFALNGVNGGYGYWNLLNVTSSDERCGANRTLPDNRYVIDLRTAIESFRWGIPSNGPSTGSGGIAAHYYGQQFSTSNRKLYRNGSEIASNTTNDTTIPQNLYNIYVMGANNAGSPNYANGRMGVFYATDGSLILSEISDFDQTLRSYLFGPIGRPTS